MSDEALTAWLNSGMPVERPLDEAASKQASEFAARFRAALDPDYDLGPTHELHQAAIAQNIFVVHADLNTLGEEAYSAAWRLLAPSERRAIKSYVEMSRSWRCVSEPQPLERLPPHKEYAI